MATQRPAAATVDAYIAAFPPDVQAVLQQVRQAVRAAAPMAEETISYQIPAYKQAGILVYFAAFKNHIGFYPPVNGDPAEDDQDDAEIPIRALSDLAGSDAHLDFAAFGAGAAAVSAAILRRILPVI